jgi:fatty-acyl-CoA synthase
LRLITQERINIFCGAPIFFQRIADCPSFGEADVTDIRIAHTGGAAVPVDLLKIWANKGVIVRQIYGQTEIGGCGVVNPRRYALSHPDKCGHGSALKDLAIIDADGKFLAAGEQGQIVMRGYGLMLGYWNNPEATAETIVDGWLRTGDIGVIDELGLLKMIDRAKDIIISGGLNISAAEVERVLLEVPGVTEAAVIAAPDEKFGETPFAIVHATTDVSIPIIVAHCAASLSGYKIPRYMVLSAEPLPRLATGKISKPALRRLYPTAASLPPPVR